MKRTDLEHLLRAAGRVIGADRIIVVGSQAVLATIPELMLPPEATVSVEADLIDRSSPKLGASYECARDGDWQPRTRYEE